MSDIIGSPSAIVSQILENLKADMGYKKYDGWIPKTHRMCAKTSSN